MQRGAVMDPEMDKMAERGQLSEWRRWLPLVVLAAAIAAFFALGLGRYLTWDAFREHRQSLLDAIARAGALAPLGFILVYTAVAALSVPGGALLTLASGFLFGTWMGGLCSLIGATIGGSLVFLIARTSVGGLLRERADRGRADARPPHHLPAARAAAAGRALGAGPRAGGLQEAAPRAGAVSERIAADVCVVGSWSGGLSVAAGASQLGMKTVLIERAKMGGDCLNYGCVPSKSLLAAAKRVRAARFNGAFGLSDAPPAVDFPAVMRHVHEVIAAIAPNDSVERFEGMGVRVVQAGARFAGPQEVTAGDLVVAARRIVIATGSAPTVPPIPGLQDVPFLTNETVFDNDVLPEHLIVIGGGPIGLEMAQAHRLLGARVTVLEAARVLAKEDPELAEQ